MVARRSRANLGRESVRVRPPSAPDPPFFGECNANEEDATEVKAQNERDQSDVDPCLTNDIDDHTKPDQHGRGRCDFGRSSAHPPGRQALLRRRGFARDRLWSNAAQLSENANLRVPNRASRTQCTSSKLLIFMAAEAFPPRFVHGRFTQFVAISLRRYPTRTMLAEVLGSSVALCVGGSRSKSGLDGTAETAHLSGRRAEATLH